MARSQRWDLELSPMRVLIIRSAPMRSIACVILACVLSGCGSTKVWYQAGKSVDETKRDWAACQTGAAAVNNPAAMVNLGFFLANEGNKSKYLDNCMIAKGYSLVDKNSLPAGVVGVPK